MIIEITFAVRYLILKKSIKTLKVINSIAAQNKPARINFNTCNLKRDLMTFTIKFITIIPRR